MEMDVERESDQSENGRRESLQELLPFVLHGDTPLILSTNRLNLGSGPMDRPSGPSAPLPQRCRARLACKFNTGLVIVTPTGSGRVQHVLAYNYESKLAWKICVRREPQSRARGAHVTNAHIDYAAKPREYNLARLQNTMTRTFSMLSELLREHSPYLLVCKFDLLRSADLQRGRIRHTVVVVGYACFEVAVAANFDVIGY